MPFRSGSVGYARFRVVGDVPAAPDEALCAALRAHLVKPPSIGEPSEVMSGFCTGRHVFDAEFTYECCGFGPSLLAAMRLDTSKVPSEIKRAYRVMAEDARRAAEGDGIAALSRSARRDAKDEAEERCKRELAEGKYRRISMVPFLWDLPSGALLAPISGDGQFQELKGLLDVGCSVRLERRSAGTVALDLLAERGSTAVLEDALPDALVDRPDAASSEHAEEAEDPGIRHFRAAGRPEVPWACAGGEPTDFLGNLFLLWLWWQCDANEGIVETAGPTVAVVIERQLDMECAWGVTGTQSLRGDTPTRVAEAAKALQSGKWPRKAGLILAAHGDEYRCTLQGDRFVVSGLTLPKSDETNRLSPRQMLEERVDRLLTFDRILLALYDAFLRERFGPSWDTRAGQLKHWIANMSKPAGRGRGATGAARNATSLRSEESVRLGGSEVEPKPNPATVDTMVAG